VKPDQWVVETERAVGVEHLSVPCDGAPDVTVRRYGPDLSNADLAPLLWVHGGAFIGGGLEQHESHAVALAIAAQGRPVVTLQYRLSPAVNWLKPAREENLKPGSDIPPHWTTSPLPFAG